MIFKICRWLKVAGAVAGGRLLVGGCVVLVAVALDMVGALLRLRLRAARNYIALLCTDAPPLPVGEDEAHGD
jgi:hypothetical protein